MYETSLSAASTHSAENSRVESQLGNYTFFAQLIDRILEKKFPFRFIMYFSEIYFVIQFLSSCLWPLSSVYNGISNDYLEVIAPIIQISYYTLSPNMKTTHIMTIANIAIALLLIILFAFNIQTFKKNHQFYEASILICRFIYEFVLPIIIFPSSISIGYSFYMYQVTGDKLFWIDIIFNIASYLFFLILFIFIYNIHCKSLYIYSSLYGSFESKALIFVLVSSVTNPFYYLLRNFKFWVKTLVQLIHMVVMCTSLHNTFDLSFHKFSSSVIFASLATSVIFTDIYFIAATVFTAPVIIPYALLIAVFIISLFVYTFVFKRKINKILNFLEDFSNEDNQKPEEVAATEKNVIIALRIGFQYLSHAIFDLNFIRNITGIYRTSNMISACAQIISFFPPEARTLNYLLSKLYTNSNLTFSGACIAYQYKRIKSLRQSSVSTAASERIQELRQLTQNCRNEINSFWSRTSFSHSYMENLGKIIKSDKGQWNINIMNFPYNSKMVEEYSIYLAECPVQLDVSLMEMNVSQVIEEGRITTIDPAFKSFVSAYPEYLTKKVINTNGNVVVKNNKLHKRSASNSSSVFDRKLLSDVVLDADQEEVLSKKLLTFPKLRLALNRSLSDRSSTPIRLLPYIMLIFCIIIICLFIYVFLYTDKKLQEPRQSLEKLIYSTRTRFNIDIASISLLLSFAKATGRLKNIEIIGDSSSNESYIDLNSDLSKAAGQYTSSAESSLRLFLDKIASKAEKGADLYNTMPVLLNNVMNFSFCIDGVPQTVLGDLKSVYVHTFYSINELSYNKDFENWYKNNDNYCELLNNILPVSNGTETVYNNLVCDQTAATKNLFNLIRYFYITVPLIFLFITVPLLVLVLLFIRDEKKIQKILLSVDAEVKQRALEPIAKDKPIGEKISERKDYITVIPLYVTIIIILGIALSVLTYFNISHAIEETGRIDNFNNWMIHASNRMTFSAEAVFFAFQAIILNTNDMENFITRDYAINRSAADVNLFYDANSELMQSENSESSYGFDSILDDINLKQMCDSEEQGNSSSLKDVYKCSSLTQTITILKNIITEILTVPEKFNGLIDNENSLGMIDIVSNIIWPRSWNALDRISELNEKYFDLTMNELTIYNIVAVIICILIIIISFFLQNTMKMSNNANFIVLQHMKPLDIINEQELLSYLLNKTMLKNNANMGISQAIIHASSDGVISTSLNGIIESVNPAVSIMLGYTPDQMLGQQIYQFFVDTDMDGIQSQVAMMKNGQASFLFQKNASLFTDTKEEVICSVTIIGMTNENNVLQSFVFMIKDETEVDKAKKEAERAKQQSESLLYQILPRDIVLRLNEGEKEISFAVPSATICFIDIVRFSEYAAALTPSQILGTLSSLFAEFDSALANYQTLIKIKLIGDVYMAAGGLFMKDDSNKSMHAEEMVLFAFDALNVIDDTNNQLGANLNVRIGINTGGPIIAGVLGNDKPTFDIIGDPINVASRLQSTSLPGKVQISQATKELISVTNSYELEQRNEVFLKGKGKTQTYFVAPIYPTSGYQSGIIHAIM